MFFIAVFLLTLFYHTYIIQDFSSNVQGVNIIFILFFNFSNIVNHYISDFAFFRRNFRRRGFPERNYTRKKRNFFKNPLTNRGEEFILYIYHINTCERGERMKIMQNSDVPIYKQIASQFKEDIMNGRIAEGSYMPSIRALARDLKISVITTLKAYELLCDEGLISSVQGKGYIVNPQDREMVREQHLRLLEQHLLNAMESARLAGVSREDLIKTLNALYEIDN